MATRLHIGTPKQQTVNQHYDSCIKGFQHQQISKIKFMSQDGILGCIHINAKGPCLDKHVYVFHYFIAFTDKKSCFTRSFPLIEKLEAFKVLHIYKP